MDQENGVNSSLRQNGEGSQRRLSPKEETAMSNFGGKQYLVSAVIIPNLAWVVYCHTSHVLCDISHKLSDLPQVL